MSKHSKHGAHSAHTGRSTRSARTAFKKPAARREYDDTNYDEYREYDEYEEYEEYGEYDDYADYGDSPEYDEPAAPRAPKKNKFKKGLIIYLCILAVLLVAVLGVLWFILTNYQNTVNEEEAAEALRLQQIEEQKAYEKAVARAPQLAFEEWYAQTGADYWTELWFSTKAGTFDSRDAVRAHMETVFATDAVRCFKAADYTDTAPAFVLKDADNRDLARVTFSGSELIWNMSDIQLYVEGEISRSVTVAKGVKVFCNGVELGSEYAAEPTTNTPAVLSDVAGQLVQPTAWVEYTVDGLLTEPEFTVETEEGFSVTETEDGNFLLKLESENNKTYQDRAVAFVRSYQYYVLMGGNGTNGNMWATLSHLAPDMQAYKTILSSQEPIYWNTAHTNINTSNTTAGDVVVWAYNCYSVDVTYQNTANARGKDVTTEGCIRVYFMNLGDQFVITHFEML